MLTGLKRQWTAFRRLEPGQRFQAHYRQHRQSEAGKSPIRRVLYVIAGILALAVGVVLTFIPGPAILFFLIAGGLFAMQSLRIARALDWGELRLRAAAKIIRKRLSRHRAVPASSRGSHPERCGRARFL